MGELVYLTVVPNESEAELLCALLRTEGIGGSMDGMPGGGPREVVVAEDSLGRAQELLAASRGT